MPSPRSQLALRQLTLERYPEIVGCYNYHRLTDCIPNRSVYAMDLAAALREHGYDRAYFHHIRRVGGTSLNETFFSLISQDRKSVVEGKSVSVRGNLGGRRIIKKKKMINYVTK